MVICTGFCAAKTSMERNLIGRRSGLRWYEGITESVSLCLQTVFHALEISLFRLRKDAVIIGFSGLDQVKDDARELVRGCRNRFWGSEFGSHTAIEHAQSRFTLLK